MSTYPITLRSRFKLLDDPKVRAQAACRTSRTDRYIDPSWFFPDDEDENLNGYQRASKEAHALELCAVCPIRDACLETALQHRMHGIWGGKTHAEREDILRERDILKRRKNPRR